MPTRTSSATWTGDLRSGKGKVVVGNNSWEGAYSFPSRFESGTGTNPEELIGAAHAGCFSMAFAGVLGKNGFTPENVATKAAVKLEKVGEGFKITSIHLSTEAKVSDLDDESKFCSLAEDAKKGCPVSQALTGVEISVEAKLIK